MDDKNSNDHKNSTPPKTSGRFAAKLSSDTERFAKKTDSDETKESGSSAEKMLTLFFKVIGASFLLFIGFCVLVVGTCFLFLG